MRWRGVLVAASLLVGCIDGQIGGVFNADPIEGSGGGVGSVGSGDDASASGSGGAMLPDPQQHAPCENGDCWDTSGHVAACGFSSTEEDFSSGNYNVHRYASRLWADTTTTIVLETQSGAWQPAIIVALDDVVIFDGEIGTAAVTPINDGRQSSAAAIEIDADINAAIDVYVTSWDVIDDDFSGMIPLDATYTLDIDSMCEDIDPRDETAPPDTLGSEVPGSDGDNSITIADGMWGPPLRFDVAAGHHVGFRLTFAPASADVEMQVLQYNRGEVEEMAITDGGSGERVLAVLDSGANRTYWVRARGSISSGTLSATHTPFVEGAQCQTDCDRLLQLPLPTDAASDGYDVAGFVVYRYQFGRRDVLMSLRHAGREVADAGMQPFTVQDLSKGDGTKPPGHASHTDGKDVDISLYDNQGDAVWYPLCQETQNECIAGTDAGFSGELNAREIAALLASDRVTHIFLDVEFHDVLFQAAGDLADLAEIDPNLVDRFDVVQHWPNHNNHIHVRYDTAPY